MGICTLCGGESTGSWSRCYTCRSEKTMLVTQRSLAKKAGLPCDLTQAQWREVLTRFNRRCAYCQERPYQVLEHFIPLKLGGGTTLTNCIPSCRECNARKYNKHPDAVTSIPRTDIERVYEYLESLKKSRN